MKLAASQIYVLAFAVGIWSLAAQFIFNRIIYFYIANSEYVAASIISIHLLGFLIGTIFIRKVSIAPSKLVCACALAVTGASLIVWRLGAPVLGLPLTVLLAVTFGLILAALSGALVLRLMTLQRSDQRGIIIADSAGSVLGAILGGFLLVPKLGLTVSFGAVLTLQAAALLMLLWPLNKQGRRVALLLVPAIGIVISFIAPPQLGVEYLRAAEGMVLSKQSGDTRVIESIHTPYGIVSVTSEEGDEPSTSLHMDNRSLCYVPHNAFHKNSEYIIGIVSQKMLVPNDRGHLRLANIGLGCGMTLSALLENSPADATLDLIEINADMPKAQKHFWDILPANYTDQRVTTHIADGFGYFANRKDQPLYDAVVIDLVWMSNMNASHLFTVEMYQNVARNLAPDGVLAVWTEENNPMGPIARTLYQTLKQVFPNVEMQYASGIVVLYASPTREDLANFLSSEDRLYSGWLEDAETRSPTKVNRLDDLIINRYKFSLFGDNMSDRLFGQF